MFLFVLSVKLSGRTSHRPIGSSGLVCRYLQFIVKLKDFISGLIHKELGQRLTFVIRLR